MSMSTGYLSAREMRPGDVESIADYWSASTPEHLVRMGVDLEKLPARSGFVDLLNSQLDLAPEDRQSYCTIWEADSRPIGHCNVNKIIFGDQAYMHLHIWRSDGRHRGHGAVLVRASLPFFFKRLNLRCLYCEPYAENRAPNRVLEKAGFEFVKTYRTVPGPINFEQDVNRWYMSRAKYDALIG